jgi:hypothetical protein
MLFVAAADLSQSDLALLGNNIRPRRPRRFTPDQRANRRVRAAVNRSASALRERIDRLRPIPTNTAAAPCALA